MANLPALRGSTPACTSSPKPPWPVHALFKKRVTTTTGAKWLLQGPLSPPVNETELCRPPRFFEYLFASGIRQSVHFAALKRCGFNSSDIFIHLLIATKHILRKPLGISTGSPVLIVGKVPKIPYPWLDPHRGRWSKRQPISLIEAPVHYAKPNWAWSRDAVVPRQGPSHENGSSDHLARSLLHRITCRGELDKLQAGR